MRSTWRSAAAAMISCAASPVRTSAWAGIPFSESRVAIAAACSWWRFRISSRSGSSDRLPNVYRLTNKSKAGESTGVTLTATAGSPSNAPHVASKSGMSSAHGEPSVATSRRDTPDPRATRTEQLARSTTSADTEPSSIDAIGPCPREPSTMRSAAMSAAASTITPGARPRTTRRSTDQSRPLKGAANRTSVASASRRTASSASASPAPPDVSGSAKPGKGNVVRREHRHGRPARDRQRCDQIASLDRTTASRRSLGESAPVALRGNRLSSDDPPAGMYGGRAVCHLHRLVGPARRPQRLLMSVDPRLTEPARLPRRRSQAAARPCCGAGPRRPARTGMPRGA